MGEGREGWEEGEAAASGAASGASGVHLARGVVDAEVEEEAAAGGDGEARSQREALELHGAWGRGEATWSGDLVSGDVVVVVSGQ